MCVGGLCWVLVRVFVCCCLMGGGGGIVLVGFVFKIGRLGGANAAGERRGFAGSIYP